MTIYAEVSEVDTYIASPGIGGFLAFLVLAIAAWFLGTSLTRHIRKANFHADEREVERYGEAAPDTRRSIPIDPNLKPKQGPFSETVLGRRMPTETTGPGVDGAGEPSGGEPR